MHRWQTERKIVLVNVSHNEWWNTEEAVYRFRLTAERMPYTWDHD